MNDLDCREVRDLSSPEGRPGWTGRLTLALLLVLSSLAGCTSYPVGNPQAVTDCAQCGDTVAVVPLAPGSSPYTVVELAINGRAGYRFLFDTGAPATVLFLHPGTEDLALPTAGEIEVRGYGDGARPKARVANNVHLSIGPVQLHHMSVLVMRADAVQLFALPDMVFIDGIIGLDFWSRFGIEVDAADGSMMLHPLGTTGIGIGARSTPLAARGGHLYLSAKVAPRSGDAPVSMSLVLDSGDRGSLRLNADPRHGLAVPDTVRQIESRGIQGPELTLLGRVAEFDLAGLGFGNVPTAFAPVGTDPNGLGVGAVGAGILSKLRWAVDVRQGQFWLATGASEDMSFADGSFGFAAVVVSGRLRVIAVHADGAAARAGMKVGDTLVSPDGRPLSATDQTRLQAALQRLAAVDICWRRGAVDQCSTLRRAA